MSRKVSDTTGLSRLFHLNSEPWVNEKTGPEAPFVQKTKTYPDARRVRLPDTAAGVVGRLAAKRRSVRAFADAPLPLVDLATVLRAGYSAIDPDPAAPGQTFLRRPVPSAGGLYPLEIYLLVRDVEGLAKGIYHYDVLGDDLELVADGPWEEAASAAFYTWEFINDAPVILCIGAVFERTQAKYGARGYRYVLLEAGHVTQNLCLAATERDLASLCLGGYGDAALNRMLSVDGLEEAVVYTVAIGVSADNAEKV